MTFQRSRGGWFRCFATLLLRVSEDVSGNILNRALRATIPTRDDVVTRQGIRGLVETRSSGAARLEISGEFETV